MAWWQWNKSPRRIDIETSAFGLEDGPGRGQGGREQKKTEVSLSMVQTST